MVVIIIKKELREILVSGRYQFAALLILMAMMIAGWNSAKTAEHLKSLSSQRTSIDEARLSEQARSLVSVAFNGRSALKPQDNLELLVGTSEHQLPDQIDVNVDQILTIRNGRSSNPTLSDLFELDWIFVFFYLVSFAAILSSYDAICGEREQGTLQLVLGNPISRESLVLGKFIAIVLSLGALAIVGSMLNLLVVWLIGSVSVSSLDVARILLIWMVGLFFLAVMVGLGIFGSSLFRSSVSSLLTLVFVWAVMVQVIPSLARSAAEELEPVPQQKTTQANLNATLVQMSKEEMSTRPAVNGSRVLNRRRNPPSPIELHYFDYQIRMAALDRATWDDYYQRQLRQARFAERLTWLSPNWLFRSATETLAGGGIDWQLSLFEQARIHRNTLGEFIKQQDQLDNQSPHIYFVESSISERPVNPSLVPRFRYQPAGFIQTLAAAFPPIGLLVLIGFVLLGLSMVVINRYDVRN